MSTITSITASQSRPPLQVRIIGEEDGADEKTVDFPDDSGEISKSSFLKLVRTATRALQDGYESFLRQYAKLVPATSCEIRFKKVSYTVKLDTESLTQISTVGTKLTNLVAWWKARTYTEVPILAQMSGIIKPKSMTLVLGPPGSGKTSFLKLLAGRLPLNEIGGSITINAAKYTEFIPEKVVGFVSQVDDHVATLTVRETLTFAVNCMMPPVPKDDPDHELLSNLQNLKVEMFLRLLGLKSCADTAVGNGLLRGVSGGERKRVTLGEMLIIPHLAYAMDEISTGLDSAATFDIAKRLRESTELLGHSYIISLLQPPPHVFDLFDDVVLLSQGHIVYHGPRERVMAYFASIDFVIPDHKDKCDFLQEVDACVFA
jgi:ABC-type multidrug transport system ATPase subunit